MKNRNSIVTLEWLKSKDCCPESHRWAYGMFTKLFGKQARLGDVLDALECRMRRYAKRIGVYSDLSWNVCAITRFTGDEFFRWPEDGVVIWRKSSWIHGIEDEDNCIVVDNAEIDRRHRRKGWIE